MKHEMNMRAAFGPDADQHIKLVQKAAEVFGGDVETLALVYTQIKLRGTASKEELQVMGAEAVPIAHSLARAYGWERREVMAKAEAGGISFDMTHLALAAITVAHQAAEDLARERREKAAAAKKAALADTLDALKYATQGYMGHHRARAMLAALALPQGVILESPPCQAFAPRRRPGPVADWFGFFTAACAGAIAGVMAGAKIIGWW